MGARVDYREDNDDPFPRTLLCDEPLRLAIRNRHLEIARMLLEHGANPNKRYFFGSEINLVSPMDVEFLNLLLMFGADPNTRDRSGLTPLMKAVRLPQVRLIYLLLTPITIEPCSTILRLSTDLLHIRYMSCRERSFFKWQVDHSKLANISYNQFSTEVVTLYKHL